MAPAVLAHPEARPIRRSLMDTTSVAYVLCRIEDDSSLTPSVSTRISLLLLWLASIR